MSDIFKFGKDLRELLKGLLEIEEREDIHQIVLEKMQERDFESSFFFGELNRFTGSGGEILVKGKKSKGSKTKMEVGDRLIGGGITHLVESLSRTPGPNAFRSVLGPDRPAKAALRAFEIDKINKVKDNFEVSLAPLSSKEYSKLVEQVSDGLVKIPAETIPEGTMILSFLNSDTSYTLENINGSPGTNWTGITDGMRQWSVGIGKSDDFWFARFPSDDIRTMSEIPNTKRIGRINFGLSLLSNYRDDIEYKQVSFENPKGKETSHQFCLSGAVVGTRGLNTQFPIGLQTQILFQPVKIG